MALWIEIKGTRSEGRALSESERIMTQEPEDESLSTMLAQDVGGLT